MNHFLCLSVFFVFLFLYFSLIFLNASFCIVSCKNAQIGNIEEQVYKIQHLNMFWEGSLSNKERCAYVLFF